MEIKVSVSKYEQTDWFLIDLSITENDNSICYQHLCSISEPNQFRTEVSSALNFARSLMDGSTVDNNSQLTNETTEPLSIDGFKPIEVKQVTANLDLPERSEFEESSKRNEVLFLSSYLQLDVDLEVGDLDHVLKLLRSQANTMLLPVYIGKLNYLLSISGNETIQFNEFNNDLVNLFNQQLDQCESLSSDVLISDSESLAEKHEFNLPIESLSSEPFKFFKTLHVEDLNSLVREALDQDLEWSQTA